MRAELYPVYETATSVKNLSSYEGHRDEIQLGYEQGTNSAAQYCRPCYYLKALVNECFMKVAMQKAGYGEDVFSSIHDNFPFVLNTSSQEDFREVRTWLMYSKAFEEQFAFKISCCSSVKQEWMINETGSFFVEDKFPAQDVRDKIRALTKRRYPRSSTYQHSQHS